MQAKRVLLMYISSHSGHHQASLAIEKSLRNLLPECTTLNVNALHYMNPILEHIIKKSYFGLIRTRPEVWGYLYDNPSVVKSTQRLRDFIHRFNSPKFQSLLESFKPDAIVCTQAFPCGLVADMKKSDNLSVPLIGVMTDYSPHSYWIYDQVDYYIVPSDQAKEKLSQNGIAREKILNYGIPIDPKFCVNGKREQTFRQYALDPHSPVVLVMGGSQGLGPIWKVVKALERSELSLQMLILCGNNKRLYRRLKRRENRFRKKTLVFDFVDQVDAFMEISTLLITKPGGVTTAEALAKEVPLIILDPIRGQETSNANFLIEEGLAVKAQDEQEVIVLVRELLSQPAKLREIKRRIESHKRPASALEIAKFILSL